MKVALVKRRKRVRLEDVPTPVPGRGEVVLRIDGCGVCGSDHLECTAWAAEWKRFGHEIAATVATTGEGVEGVAVGDQVVVALSVACGACAGCLAGNPRHCSGLVVAEQGGFAEYLLVKDVRLLRTVAPKLPVGLAVLAEPLTVILDAFHLAAIGPGDRLAVVGGGFLSCMSVLAAKAVGVEMPVLLSRGMHPGLQVCLSATGGEHFTWRTVAGITLAAPDPFAQRLAGEVGRVVVLHTAPARYMSHYLAQLPYDTVLVNIGLAAADKDNAIKIDASRLIFKRLQILSAFPVPCLYLQQAVELLQTQQALFALLAPEVIPLEHLPVVMAASRKPRKKIIVTPWARWTTIG